jgi:hypothetical protein
MATTLSLFRPEARPTRRAAATVGEPQLFYAPPYATAEEDALAWALVRSLRPECGMRYQIPEGVNFMIETPTSRVAIMIDSDAEPTSVPADVVYFVSGEDLRERLSDVMYALSLLDPRLFEGSERAKLRRNATPQLAIEFDGDDFTSIRLRYEPEEQIVEIDGEWIVLDPTAVVFETVLVRHEA